MDQAVETEAENSAVHPGGCSSCGRALRRGRRFIFKVDPLEAEQGVTTQLAEVFKCIFCALCHPPMLRRSLTIALFVGTILALLNHGDTFLGGNWNTALYWKLPLTYGVPFCVATFGALANSRR